MKINIIYVTYYADIGLLEESIKSIEKQIYKIYIVDNTPYGDDALKQLQGEKLEIIFLKDNLGIAYAQNVGIKKSIDEGVDYVMLSDQDTVYPANYVESMLPIFIEKEDVAAVAPRFNDEVKKSVDGFIEIKPLIFKQFYPTSGLHEVMQVIASGKILNTKLLSKIGLMDEKLFIDWVDFEWCWRARKTGFKIIANANVVIRHKLGDVSKNIGYKEINLRSYIRHYYITRNAFYLALHNNSLDMLHRITLFLKAFRYLVGYPILAKPHLKNLKYVMKGFFHGAIGKQGKLDD